MNANCEELDGVAYENDGRETGGCNGAEAEAERDNQKPNKFNPELASRVVARICGPSRSKCGYCEGKRLHVLEVPDKYNKVVLGSQTENINGDEEGESSQMEQIDETKTSKSYGLLFDRLPYDTYEDLINRGWRRSGKHLYRPHNFESCCPSISIRLDVLEFASRCSTRPSTVGESYLARGVLVRGSKSQRKVGKSLLRAMELYNSKCDHSNLGGNAAGVHLKRLSSILSNDDSVHTSHVAKMQLDEGKEKVHLDPDQMSEYQHQHKKSRKRSPDQENDNDQQPQHPLIVNPKYLQPFLDRLSTKVYESITDVAMKSFASDKQGGACGNDKVEKPSWAWWNNDVDNADAAERIPKWCSFKVLQSRAGSTNNTTGEIANNVAVTASTSACAAASGRSRGDIDKSQLVRSVVDSLEKKFVVDGSQQSSSDEDKLQVVEVSCHEKSAHVHLTIHASPSALIAGVDSSPSKTACVSKRSRLAFNQMPSSKNVDELDPIAEFMTRQKMKPYQQKRYLTVRSIPAYESSLQVEVHQLFCQYQTDVHGDFDPFFGTGESSNGEDHTHDYAYYKQKNLPGFLDIDVAYNHESETRRSKIKTSYVTFYRFLCETPVAHQNKVPDSLGNLSDEDGYDIHIPFGTYHQQYRLSTSKDAFDGPLIAVGVVDILPESLSSVYAFYDPNLSSQLNLGKYTALREIEWVIRASQFRPELHYYYLGYYIHSCQKMTYKAEYKPSELLCPVNYKWVDFESAKKKLEEESPIRHCCALYNEPPSAKNVSNGAERPRFGVDDITLDIGEKEPHLVQVEMLNKEGREFVAPHVNEFVAEVGDICHKFIIKLR